MRIAITTPTGHIGGEVVRLLQGTGAKLVLLVRDPNKVREFLQRGAEIRQGSLDDVRFVTEATIGVDSLFWLTPPNFGAPDLRGFQAACGRAAAEAVRANRIPYVVNLSSVGAQNADGVGPINGLHDAELLLNAAAPNLIHLRAGFFFENFLWQLEPMRTAGSVFLPAEGRFRLPMIATRDIAAVAAELLLDPSWTGRRVRGLHGPADLSLPEAVEIIARALEKPLRYVQIAEEQARKNMRAAGMGESAIEGMLEMYRAFDSGQMRPAEPRSPETTTPTTLTEFTHEVIAPLIHEPIGAGH